MIEDIFLRFSSTPVKLPMQAFWWYNKTNAVFGYVSRSGCSSRYKMGRPSGATKNLSTYHQKIARPENATATHGQEPGERNRMWSQDGRGGILYSLWISPKLDQYEHLGDQVCGRGPIALFFRKCNYGSCRIQSTCLFFFVFFFFAAPFIQVLVFVLWLKRVRVS